MHRDLGVRQLISTRMRRRQIKRQTRLLACRHQPTKLEMGTAGYGAYSDGRSVTSRPEFDALDVLVGRSQFWPDPVDCVLRELDLRGADAALADAGLIIDAFPATISPEKRRRDMSPDCGAPTDGRGGSHDA